MKGAQAKNQIKYIPISIQEASARYFLKFAGINTIPVLITKKGSNISLIVGDEKILSHYAQNNIAPSITNSISVSQQTTNTLSTSFLNAGSKDAGCPINIIETTTCDKNTSKAP